MLSNEPTKEGTVANRFGGDTCTLPEFAIAVYDVIMGAEMVQDLDILAEPRAVGLAALCARYPKDRGRRPSGGKRHRSTK